MNFTSLTTSYTSELTKLHDSRHGNRHNRFTPGGDIYKAMVHANQNNPVKIMAKFGDWIFVHGGIVKSFLTMFNIDYLKEFNIAKFKGNRGEKIIQLINYIVDCKFKKIKLNSELEKLWEVINNKNGPIWTRKWGQECCDNEGNDCKELRKTFKYMFNDNNKYKLGIAHCTQLLRGPSFSSNKRYCFNHFNKKCKSIICGNTFSNKDITAYCGNGEKICDSSVYPGITFDCDKTLWRLDAAMSRGFDFNYTYGMDHDKMMIARRPQGLLIIKCGTKEYTIVVKSNYDLPR